MHPVCLTIAQTSTSGPLTPEARQEVKSTAWELFIALLALVIVTVVVMLVMRKHHRAALRTLRMRRKATEMEDLWFENPIERHGGKPPAAASSPDEPTPPPDDNSVP